ncbi:unnamed protein product [Zymoseptoria tritici ST99CH_1E4]|uniref:Uncharacterized protein n=1 Tax=Zymoseptoria tritici ST99CH_1E4 TaxID=1276532 RepID=A0A2H1FY78_ZYMTR|nr:unnamed protein product [Zymoseptoria tritici ST99CH_1E4]
MFSSALRSSPSAQPRSSHNSPALSRGDLTGLSSGKIIIDQLVATYSLAMVIVAMFGYPLGDDPLSAAQRLDITQFAVVWVGQVSIFCLYLVLPPFDLSSVVRKVCFTLVALLFAGLTLYPAIGGTTFPRDDDDDWNSWSRNWFWTWLIYPMIVINPLSQLLGLIALYLQVKILKPRRPPGSLSINGLLTQTFVFFVVGVSMIFRVKVPAQRPLRLLEWLLLWYAMVGFATLNSLIFAFSQGALWWHARRQFVEAEVSECEALLQQIE